MRVAHGVTDYQTTITTAAPHARDRASERALSQRAAHACVRGGGRETVMTCAMRGGDARMRRSVCDACEARVAGRDRLPDRCHYRHTPRARSSERASAAAAAVRAREWALPEHRRTWR